jgi:hypothetical protein
VTLAIDVESFLRARAAEIPPEIQFRRRLLDALSEIRALPRVVLRRSVERESWILTVAYFKKRNFPDREGPLALPWRVPGFDSAELDDEPRAVVEGRAPLTERRARIVLIEAMSAGTWDPVEALSRLRKLRALECEARRIAQAVENFLGQWEEAILS